MLHSVMLTLGIISVVIAFGTVVFMMMQKSTFAQKILLILTFAIGITNLGGTLELTAESLEQAVAYFQFKYIGLAFLGFMCMLFCVKFAQRRIVPVLEMIAFVNGVCNLVFVSTCRHHNIIFFDFEFDTITKILVYKTGPYYYIDLAVSVVIVVYGLINVIIAWRDERNSFSKKRFASLFVIMIISLVGYCANEIFFIPQYDIMPYVLSIIMPMLIYMMKHYNLADIVADARETILGNMADILIVVDDNMKVRDVNDAGFKAFPELAEMISNEISGKYAFISRNMDQRLDFIANGIHYERRVSEMVYRGQKTGYGIILRDVTEHYRTLMQMRQLKKKADAASESKSSFLTNMSHEIRTPMNAIVGYSDLISREKIDGDVLKYTQSIKTAANSLLHIINDILDFSKIEQGRLEIVDEEYLTEQLFKEITDIMAIAAEKKKLKLISTIEPDVPGVLFGDRMRIRQVIRNVVNNAVKFTDSGSVRINTEWEPIGDDIAELSIIVSDTGIGIKTEDLSKIFTEFEQAQLAKNQTNEGTGLGLSIARSLIQMMGGTISIESEYGVGTSVIITLRQRIIDRTPIAEMIKADMRGEQPEETSSNKVMIAPEARILVVDDNKVNLELMQNYLRVYKIKPVLADGGAKSVEEAAKQHFDIIFMDQMMPEMDGIEAMKNIRALNSGSSELVIVALTANAIAGTRNALLNEGFTDYASKPIGIKELEALLVKYLPKDICRYVYEDEEESFFAAPQRAKQSRGGELPAYIDRKIGLDNCNGDEKQYESVIEIVFKYADEKLVKLKELYLNGDFENYTIDVHALKSNAATIGAMKLADKAKALEMAGREQNYDYIRRETESFFEEYYNFARDLESYLRRDSSDGGDAGESGTDMMNAKESEYIQTFREIAECIKNDRCSDALDLFGVLEFFELPPVIRHAEYEMKKKADIGEWSAVSEMILGLDF